MSVGEWRRRDSGGGSLVRMGALGGALVERSSVVVSKSAVLGWGGWGKGHCYRRSEGLLWSRGVLATWWHWWRFDFSTVEAQFLTGV